ncbi:MAG: DUF4230 domain-containing protein [Patescibacteria group bacterium]
MKLSTKFILALLGALIFLGLGGWLGYRLTRPAAGPATQINSQSILTALHDRGFLVTQTFVFNQPATIKKTTGSALGDFFFGQTITARGTMEVNLGIDLAKVAAEDVVISDSQIKVVIPHAQLFNARLVGPLEVKNEKGLLKRLTDSDPGYNEAQQLLGSEAEKAALKPELLSRAEQTAKEDTARLLGYVAPGKTITVEFK